jgi:hypothetical protein
MATGQVACERCGVPTYKHHKAPVAICRDCRSTDPTYVLAIRTGQRCA